MIPPEISDMADDAARAQALEAWLVAEAARRPPLPPPRPREERPEDPPLFARLDAGAGPIALPGPGPCRRCGEALERVGICPRCAAAMLAAEVEASLRPARESVPPEYRWALTPDAPELAERCRRVRSELGEHSAASFARKAALRLCLPPSEDRSLLVLVIGGQTEENSRHGKSVLAARIAHEILAAGAASGLVGEPPVETRMLGIARRTRWVSALELSERAVSTERSSYERAMEASILVLDDLGQEGRETYAGKERAALAGKLLMMRWPLGRPTILPTYLGPAGIADVYLGGVHGRLFDDARATRVEVSRG